MTDILKRDAGLALNMDGLATGLHTFLVRAFDLNGNADLTPAKRTWTISS